MTRDLSVIVLPTHNIHITNYNVLLLWYCYYCIIIYLMSNKYGDIQVLYSTSPNQRATKFRVQIIQIVSTFVPQVCSYILLKDGPQDT